MQSSKNLVSGNTNDKREWHSELTVVMPVLNEQSCIAQVVNEWLVALRLSSINFKIMVLDNGSTDGTFEELQALSKINK